MAAQTVALGDIAVLRRIAAAPIRGLPAARMEFATGGAVAQAGDFARQHRALAATGRIGIGLGFDQRRRIRNCGYKYFQVS